MSMLMDIRLSGVKGDAKMRAACSTSRARIACVVRHVDKNAPIVLDEFTLDGGAAWGWRLIEC
jgi:hypothetical protein